MSYQQIESQKKKSPSKKRAIISTWISWSIIIKCISISSRLIVLRLASKERLSITSSRELVCLVTQFSVNCKFTRASCNNLIGLSSRRWASVSESLMDASIWEALIASIIEFAGLRELILGFYSVIKMRIIGIIRERENCFFFLWRHFRV